MIDAARRDARISGVALTGSSAIDAEDRWSDIDVAFDVASGADRGALIAEGRGMDLLPASVTAPMADALVRSLDAPELCRAFAYACDLLLGEIGAVDADLARRLTGTIRELASVEDN